MASCQFCAGTRSKVWSCSVQKGLSEWSSVYVSRLCLVTKSTLARYHLSTLPTYFTKALSEWRPTWKDTTLFLEDCWGSQVKGHCLGVQNLLISSCQVTSWFLPCVVGSFLRPFSGYLDQVKLCIKSCSKGIVTFKVWCTAFNGLVVLWPFNAMQHKVPRDILNWVLYRNEFLVAAWFPASFGCRGHVKCYHSVWQRAGRFWVSLPWRRCHLHRSHYSLPFSGEWSECEWSEGSHGDDL